MDFEKFVEELKKKFRFKETTETGDVALMVQEGQDEKSPVGLSYVYVNGFERDPGKRDEWWFVHLHFLLAPPVPQTLILQRPHFTGQEIFTMGGKKVFIKAVDLDQPEKKPAGDKDAPPPKRSSLRVVKK
ncbi:MAG: hypothetical protein V1816_24280 [Pseudomonadota bacterium]